MNILKSISKQPRLQNLLLRQILEDTKFRILNVSSQIGILLIGTEGETHNNAVEMKKDVEVLLIFTMSCNHIVETYTHKNEVAVLIHVSKMLQHLSTNVTKVCNRKENYQHQIIAANIYDVKKLMLMIDSISSTIDLIARYNGNRNNNTIIDFKAIQNNFSYYYEDILEHTSQILLFHNKLPATELKGNIVVITYLLHVLIGYLIDQRGNDTTEISFSVTEKQLCVEAEVALDSIPGYIFHEDFLKLQNSDRDDIYLHLINQYLILISGKFVITRKPRTAILSMRLPL